MKTPRTVFIATATLLLLFCASARAQEVCESGNGELDTSNPKGMEIEDVVKKFTEREAALKKAMEGYSFTVDLLVQTLSGDGGVTGELKRTTEVGFDDRGKRHETVAYSTVSTMRALSVTPDDFDDANSGMLGLVTSDNAKDYFVHYTGHQPVDQLKAYVFEIAPKKVDRGRVYFQGKVWVDDADFVIVKTCGKTIRTDTMPQKNPRGRANVMPTFVTYREQVDGANWFPTYSKADEVIEFPRGLVHMKETVRHTKYKRAGAAAAAN